MGLLKLLKEIDVEEDLELDFPDFLRLVRQFHDLQERDRIMKEQDAIRSTGFTLNEVEEFRDLFMADAIDGYNKLELSFFDFARMIGQICPLGDVNRSRLRTLFNEVVKERRKGSKSKFVDISFRGGDENNADFP